MFKFGRKPKRTAYDTLQLRHYLAALNPPPPPTTTSNLTRMLTSLNMAQRKIPVLFPMDGNDSIGDCTICAVSHAITAWKAFLGQKYIMSQSAVEQLYYHLTGGPDDGLDELTVLQYWAKSLVGPDEILGFAAVQPSNHEHVKQAIALFGGVYIGFQCTTAIDQQFNARTPWTPAPLTQDGHATYAFDFTDAGVNQFTWGSTQWGTWAWWDECVDECYVILPPEARDPGYMPGVDLSQLTADMAALKG